MESISNSLIHNYSQDEKTSEHENASISEMITVTELQEALGVGRDVAYNLVRRKDFPSIKLGREYRIFKDRLTEWLVKQQKNK